MYITIEGPIGVGKSSLTNILSNKFELEPLYEIVEENPFLSRFYEDSEKWAFQTEMFFLTNRYTQLKDFSNQPNKNVVADYDIHKNMIFAKKTLSSKELAVFEDVFSCLTNNILNSDLTIFLTANINTLKKRISLRGRVFEQDIDNDYLYYLIDAYNDFIEVQLQNKPQNTIVFNCDDLDFVNNTDDYDFIIESIKNKIMQEKK